MKYIILFSLSILLILPVQIQAQTSLLERDCKQSFLRKGIHLGGHIAPGVGRISQESIIGEDDDSEIAFAMNAGLDVVYYFNDVLGLKSGIEYSMIQANYSFNYNLVDSLGHPIQPIYSDGTEVQKLQTIGIPLKALWTTKAKVGLYLDGGLVFSFTMDSYSTIQRPYFNEKTDLSSNLNSFVLNFESTVGLNVQLSDNTSLNLGLLTQIPLTDYYASDRYSDGGFLFALQVGVMWKLKES